TGSLMQVALVPPYGGKQSVYGPLVLRCVAMHFATHFPFEPTNFARVLPVPDSHFCSSLLGSVICAGTDVASKNKPVAAIAVFPNHPTIVLPLPVWLL